MENPYIFNSSPKTYQEDQDKCMSPEETYKKIWGILHKVFPDTTFNLTELESNDYYSVYDFSDGKLSSHGKGAAKYQAMTSAIMEYLERKSWLDFNISKTKGFIKASYNKLSNIVQIPEYKNIFNVHYFDNKEETAELIKDIPLFWTEAYNLTKKTETLYPVNFIDFLHTSNGLATGNTKEEAITQGLCELIEREHIDNFLLAPYTMKTKLIDNSTIKNPYLLKLLEWGKINNIKISLLDISNSIPLCTIVANCIDDNPPISFTRKIQGYGAHTDPEKAMIRAITESLQAREGYIKIAPKDFDLAVGHWQTRLSIDFNRVMNNAELVPVKDCYNIANSDFKKEAEKIISILKKKGHEVIALNITHPDLKIPVYRLLIPTFKPGDEFSAFARNQHFIITSLFKNAGLDKKAKEYYSAHKDELSKLSKEEDCLISELSRVIKDIDFDEIQNNFNDFVADDLIYKLMIPRDHMNSLRFANYAKNDMIAALNCLGVVNVDETSSEQKTT